MIAAIAGAPFVCYTEDAPSGLAGIIGVQIRDAQDNVTEARATDIIREVVAGSGVYQANFAAAPTEPGPYVVVWDTGGGSPQYATELLQVTPGSAYVPPGDITTVSDLTDLAVLIPWARRACEGPYGPPEGKPVLLDSQVYPMIADACSEIILFSGSLFGHRLNVTDRDPLAGYPTQWKTDKVLDQWEGAVIISQTALDYFRVLFRDLKTSVSVKNEGTEYTYSLSANVLRDYIADLQNARDMALEGLRRHNPVLDRYVSNIRVRDRQTTTMLEWWSTNEPDAAGGMPGGQEAYAVPAVGLPWGPAWSGGW